MNESITERSKVAYFRSNFKYPFFYIYKFNDASPLKQSDELIFI